MQKVEPLMKNEIHNLYVDHRESLELKDTFLNYQNLEDCDVKDDSQQVT